MPWGKAGSLIRHWLPNDAWPEDIKFQEPSRLHKQDCIHLILHWQEMDEVTTEGFRFTGWIQDGGNPATAEYEQYIEAWKKDAPMREERQRMLAEYQASKASGKATSGKSQPSPVQRPTELLPPSRGHPGASASIRLP